LLQQYMHRIPPPNGEVAFSHRYISRTVQSGHEEGGASDAGERTLQRCHFDIGCIQYQRWRSAHRVRHSNSVRETTVEGRIREADRPAEIGELHGRLVGASIVHRTMSSGESHLVQLQIAHSDAEQSV